jgi:hypothetical protein
MSDRIIKPKEGLEIFVNKGGTITIKQISALDEEMLIVVQPEDVDQVCQFLQDAREEASEWVPEEEQAQ